MRFDPHGNPYLIWTYTELTPEKKLAYFHQLGDTLTSAKRDYYLKTETAMSDGVYDYLERLYGAVAEDLGLEPSATNQVGYKE